MTGGEVVTVVVGAAVVVGADEVVVADEVAVGAAVVVVEEVVVEEEVVLDGSVDSPPKASVEVSKVSSFETPGTKPAPHDSPNRQGGSGPRTEAGLIRAKCLVRLPSFEPAGGIPSPTHQSDPDLQAERPSFGRKRRYCLEELPIGHTSHSGRPGKRQPPDFHPLR